MAEAGLKDAQRSRVGEGNESSVPKCLSPDLGTVAKVLDTKESFTGSWIDLCHCKVT